MPSPQNRITKRLSPRTESPSDTPFSEGPPAPPPGCAPESAPGLQPRGPRLAPFSAASDPRAPGPLTPQPLKPRVCGGGGEGVPGLSQSRSARLPAPAEAPGLGGARSVSKVARGEAHGARGGAELREPAARAGAPPRAQTHLPCPAPRWRPACSPTAGRGRDGASDAPCHAACSRPDPRPAPARPPRKPASVFRSRPLPARHFSTSCPDP